MSIPKVIHYCWFGHGEMPESAKQCIASWKRFCPDYQIIEWNETNFDIDMLPYTQEAYLAKKYAFVTDYVRLYVLYNNGGIYMDTDVEVTKSLDPFLLEDAFSGFESKDRVPTGIMGCHMHFPLFKELLQYYDGRHFLLDNDEYDLTTNVDIITNILINHGLVKNGSLQRIDGFALYPSDYFCPKDPITRKLKLTDRTHAIHHFDGSWIPDSQKTSMAEYRRFTFLFGEKFGEIIYLVYMNIRTHGIATTIKKICIHLANN